MSNRENLCRGCGLRFAGMAAFDKHRTGDYGELIYHNENTHVVVGQKPHTRRCMQEDEMKDAGMRQRENRTWSTGIPKGSGR